MHKVVNLRKRTYQQGGGYLVVSTKNRITPEPGSVIDDATAKRLIVEAGNACKSGHTLDINIKEPKH